MSSIRPEPFGPERLDLSSSTGLKAEGLMAEGSRTVKLGWTGKPADGLTGQLKSYKKGGGYGL